MRKPEAKAEARRAQQLPKVPLVSQWAGSEMVDENGERGRNRTYNLVIKSHLLCQLSYAPTRHRASRSRGDAQLRRIAYGLPDRYTR